MCSQLLFFLFYVLASLLHDLWTNGPYVQKIGKYISTDSGTSIEFIMMFWVLLSLSYYDKTARQDHRMFTVSFSHYEF